MGLADKPLPAGVSAGDRIVLFDGVCAFCSAWSRFLIKRDPGAALRLAAIQSRTGQALLAWAGLPTDRVDTMVFVDRGKAYVRTDAFLRVVRHLGGPWRWLAWGVAVPRPFRDWVYDQIATRRLRIFGTVEECLVPVPEVRARFFT
jgi:predicted DCC family thiol-disulfide oxidoreductase YuxK